MNKDLIDPQITQIFTDDSTAVILRAKPEESKKPRFFTEPALSGT